MIGHVDNAGRALVGVELSASRDGPSQLVTAWIDTGFTGELVLPHTLIDELVLTLTGTTGAVLADGSRVAMATYECFVPWFGEQRRLEVVANQGVCPLLGVGLLVNHELRIDYRQKSVSLE